MSRKHNVKSKKLNRNYNQRQALIRQQLNALIKNGQLVTTQAKAKLIKSLFDKLAAKARSASLHHLRQIASTLSHPQNASRLVKTIVPAMSSKTGGFTKITKLYLRRGDAAPMAKLELSVAPPPAKTSPENKSTKTKTKTVDKKTKSNK